MEKINLRDVGIGSTITFIVGAIGDGIKSAVDYKKNCRKRELKRKMKANQETIRSNNWMCRIVKDATYEQYGLMDEFLKIEKV